MAKIVSLSRANVSIEVLASAFITAPGVVAYLILIKTLIIRVTA